jgi:hypothetical protein
MPTIARLPHIISFYLLQFFPLASIITQIPIKICAVDGLLLARNLKPRLGVVLTVKRKRLKCVVSSDF